VLHSNFALATNHQNAGAALRSPLFSGKYTRHPPVMLLAPTRAPTPEWWNPRARSGRYWLLAGSRPLSHLWAAPIWTHMWKDRGCPPNRNVLLNWSCSAKVPYGVPWGNSSIIFLYRGDRKRTLNLVAPRTVESAKNDSGEC